MPSATPKTAPPLTEQYELEDIEKAKAPSGLDGADWFRYTIVQGQNRITGYRQGSQRTVTKAVKDIVVELNERRGGKKGRVHLTSSRKQQKSS
ncbi:MAG: hypothetical protein OEU86_00420 [Gammaproteobacteria bacterium]|nr:hypothetical protein [Gammaproteobacteria bacterium]